MTAWHRWVSGPDGYGFLPTVFARQRPGQRDRTTWDVETDELAAKRQPIPLEQETLMEGPPRHADLVQWAGDGAPRGAFFIVSERVHTLLQLAALPPCVMMNVELEFAKQHHKKSGIGRHPYVLYAFSEFEQLDAFDLTKTELSCTVMLCSDREAFAQRLPLGAVKNAAEAWAIARQHCPKGARPLVLPSAFRGPLDRRTFEVQLDFSTKHFPLAMRDLDLFFLPGEWQPRVSDGLREALVAMGASGMGFSDPWDESRIAAPHHPKSTKTRAIELLSAATRLCAKPPEESAFTRALERRREVLARGDRVRAQRKHGRSQGDGERALREVEDRLDVLLPPVYREALASGTLPRRGAFRFFSHADLRTLDQVDAGWSEKSAPEAVRALLVAVDEHGDYLGYLLRADSLTQLDAQLMHFHHESAVITKSRTKLKAPT